VTSIRLESRCGQKFVFSRKSLRYAALGTGCTLTAVPRSTQPSTLRGTVNEYHLWLSNNTWRWANVRPIATYRRTKVQVFSLAYELAAIWRWPTLAQTNHSELSHMAGAVDDSTINIVVVIIIINTYADLQSSNMRHMRYRWCQRSLWHQLALANLEFHS